MGLKALLGVVNSLIRRKPKNARVNAAVSIKRSCERTLRDCLMACSMSARIRVVIGCRGVDDGRAV